MPGNLVFLLSETDMSGNFLCCVKHVKYRFEFQEGTWDFSQDAAVGNGLIGNDGGTSWFFSSCGGILELRPGTQGASRVAPGKSNLHLSFEGELGIALKSLQGKKISSRLVSRNSVFLSSGDRDLGVAFKAHPGSQALSRVEAKNSALLAS